MVFGCASQSLKKKTLFGVNKGEKETENDPIASCDPAILCSPISYLLAVFTDDNYIINQGNGTSENETTVLPPTEPPPIALGLPAED